MVVAGANDLVLDDSIRKTCVFYASFDEKPEADLGAGDRTLWTRADDPADTGRKILTHNYDHERYRIVKDGISGGAMEFLERSSSDGFILFRGRDNLAIRKGGWGGAASIWVLADVDKIPEISPWDPLLIGGKAWNNGAVWLDFAPGKPPRDLRLGLFPTLPAGTLPPDVHEAETSMLLVKVPEFRPNHWHHFVMTWDRFDSGQNDAVVTAYLDGKRLGSLKNRDGTMNWDADEVRIQFGAGLIGRVDELALFRRPLSEAEVEQLYRVPGLMRESRELDRTAGP